MTATGSQTPPVPADANRRAPSGYPRDATVHGEFAARAAATPDAIALESDTERLTYRELETRANQLALALAAAGAAPGRCVGICLPRSPTFVIAMLATLKTGAAYVPLDPTLPRERLAFMVADCATPVIVTEPRYADLLPAGSAVIDSMPPPNGGAFTPHTGTALDPAYVMYTSGSTGHPKGVVVPHRGIVRLVHGEFIHFGADEVFLALAPVGFDASTLEIWGALLHGARLAVFTAPHPVPAAIGEAIRRFEVTTLWLTAALFQQVVDIDIEILRPLRQLLSGGDVLSVTHAARVVEQFAHLRFVNGYGPTENTTFTCCHQVVAADLSQASIPIGRPIAHTTVYVVDAHDALVPIGVEGELVTGGDGLALGYLGQPELTAEKFVADPFQAGERVYRTGDRARWRRDGTIEFLGRRDFQVKLRGFRVELEEIDAVLMAHPSVAAAVTTLRRDAPGEERLAAYVVSRLAVPLDEPALRAHLRRRLPEHMIPASFTRLDALPLSSGGKVDRSALPAPAANAAIDASDALAGQVDATVAACWREVLPRTAVGRHTSFLDVGGHSLLAVRFLAALERATGQTIALADFLRQPTIAAVTERLEQPATTQRPAIIAQPRRGGRPR